MGQDEVTLNIEPPRKDVLDGRTRIMIGLRPRNLVRCTDVTCIVGMLLFNDVSYSNVH